MRIINFRINHMKEPFVDAAPEFSWQIESDENSVFQTAYQINVCDEKSEVWNSGKVLSNKQSFIKYGGTLKSKTQYSVCITVWDNKGNCSALKSKFETAFLNADEWKGCFSKSPFDRNESKVFVYGIENPPVYFKKDFDITDEVIRARLYATAYGAYNAYVGGKKVGDAVLAPEYTPYNKILNYQVYDVTDMLTNGKNKIEFLVGDGWFFCPQTEITTDEKIDNLSVLYQLEIEYKGGKSAVVFSDGNEICRKSNIVFSDLFMGEKVDFTLPESERKKAIATDYSLKNLRLQPIPQIKAVEKFDAKEVYISPKGETIVDFGQVIAGRCKIKINGARGTEIKLEHTEITDKDGNYFAQFDLVKQTDIVVCSGEPFVFESEFSFHGFRYLKVSGMINPVKEDFTAVLLSTEKENIGNFVCDDERFNRLYKNIRYSQKNNMMSVPTDCPSREKAGWTGDILVYAKTAMQNEDMTAFLSSWIKGLAADQKEDGVIPITSPFNKVYEAVAKQTMAPFGDELTGVAGWSDAMVWVPYDMYHITGNKHILEQHYLSMKKWCDYIIKTAEEKRGSDLPYEYDRYLWNTGFHFGEWLVPGREAEGFEICKETACYIAPFFGYMTLAKMSEISSILKTDDEKYYKMMSEKFKYAIQNGLMKSDILPDYLQGLYVLAIAFDLVSKENEKQYADKLISLVEKNNGCLCTGFLATPYLLDVLCKVGRWDLAKNILLQTKRPSWLFEVEHGATAIWEDWFALDDENNPKKTSYDHYAFGVVDDFIFRKICGISAIEPGFSKFKVAPIEDDVFGNWEREFISEYGKIKVKKTEETLEVTVPCNTTAVIEWNGKTYEKESGKYILQ